MAEAKEHKRDQKRRREGHYLRVARIAYAIAQEALPRYSHPIHPAPIGRLCAARLHHPLSSLPPGKG